MSKIDLHIHTYYSDGEDSLSAIFKRLKENNVSFFSISDHNYISPDIVQIRDLASKNNMVFLMGVEISCIDRITGESLHILGYSQSFDIEQLNTSLHIVVDGYNKRAKKIIEKLNNQYKGFNLDFEELRQRKKEANISRNTLATELIGFLGEKRVTMKEALKEAFVEETDSWMPDSKEAIQMIRDAGGVAVLAHPGSIVKSLANFESLLKRLITYGIIGIEAYYPKHEDKMINFLNYLGETYNLAITAGSDWHGEKYTPGRAIGFELEDKKYKKILELFR